MRIIILTKTNHNETSKLWPGSVMLRTLNAKVLRMVNSYPSFPAVFPAMPSRVAGMKNVIICQFSNTLLPLLRKTGFYYLKHKQSMNNGFLGKDSVKVFIFQTFAEKFFISALISSANRFQPMPTGAHHGHLDSSVCRVL